VISADEIRHCFIERHQNLQTRRFL